MGIVINCQNSLTIEELVHIEQSLKKLRHIVQIGHTVACQEFTECHPVMAQWLRDYITACINQGNALLHAQAHVNKAYRFIIENATDEGSPQ